MAVPADSYIKREDGEENAHKTSGRTGKSPTKNGFVDRTGTSNGSGSCLTKPEKINGRRVKNEDEDDGLKARSECQDEKEDKKAVKEEIEDEKTVNEFAKVEVVKEEFVDEAVKETAEESAKETAKDILTKRGGTKKEETRQTFVELESKTEEALSTFKLIDECIFANKSLGNSGQDEVMACDCRPMIGSLNDDGIAVNEACGEDSDCINRLTSIECVNEMCNCGEDCQNQRFQKHQYAKVDIIQTEKKGYGMRALQDITANTFIYEYIGEVIDENKFRKKMKLYEEQGIKHFYFMMLQKGEFIDATQKGCLARFCNHSCRPNCFVDKWVVGDKLRMGIFSKRHIARGEEITFDYNVDRYGSQAQPCYCGESNCIGYLGGKTQTEAASKLPQLIVEALGLDDQDESQWITTTAKKKRAKKKASQQILQQELVEDYEEYLPTKPVDTGSVSKVMSSLLQSTREEWLIKKLISRIHITNDNQVQLEVMRMHGYQIFSVLLRDWKHVENIVVMILEILTQWPRMTKNKISSSKIESTVKELQEHNESMRVQELAKSLVQEWSVLQMAYRIPRRERSAVAAMVASSGSGSPEEDKPQLQQDKKTSQELRQEKLRQKKLEWKKRRREDDEKHHKKAATNGVNVKLPPGWNFAYSPEGKIYYFHREKDITTWEKPKFDSPEISTPNQESQIKAEQKATLEKIIEQAQEQQRLQQQQQQQQQEEAEQNMAKKVAKSKSKSKSSTKSKSISASQDNDHSHRHHTNSQSNNRNHKDTKTIEQTLTHTFALYVPNIVAKLGRELNHEDHKKCSKEIVHVLVSKETRDGHEVKDPTKLSDEKKKKIYAFVKMYVEKVVAKKRAKKSDKRHKPEDDVANSDDRNIHNHQDPDSSQELSLLGQSKRVKTK